MGTIFVSVYWARSWLCTKLWITSHQSRDCAKTASTKKWKKKTLLQEKEFVPRRVSWWAWWKRMRYAKNVQWNLWCSEILRRTINNCEDTDCTFGLSLNHSVPYVLNYVYDKECCSSMSGNKTLFLCNGRQVNSRGLTSRDTPKIINGDTDCTLIPLDRNCATDRSALI